MDRLECGAGVAYLPRVAFGNTRLTAGVLSGMLEAPRIADQLRRARSGDAGHGSSLSELLLETSRSTNFDPKRGWGPVAGTI
jgi:hypothetical protein